MVQNKKQNQQCNNQVQKKKDELTKVSAELKAEIDRRKKVEGRLEHDSFLLNTLLNASEDSIYFKDRESRFTTVSRAMARKLGVKSPEDLIHKTDYDFFTEEHAQNAFRDEQEILKNGVPVIGKVEKETWPDGSVSWVNTSKMPIYNANKQIIGIVGITRDITELKEAEQKITASEERFRSLIRHLSDMILIIDLDTKITYASDSCKRVLGMDPQDIIGTLASDLVHPKDQEPMREGLERVVNHKTKFQPTDLKCRHPEKGWVNLDVIGNNLIGYPGIDGIVVTARDITERKKAEVEAEKIFLELERSNIDLEQFAYAVSHDLQEPLRKVKNFAELLSLRYESSLDEKATQYINYMVDGSQRMQVLIQDLLSYSRITTKGEPFRQIDSGIMLRDAMANLELIISESKGKIEFGNMPEMVADGSQLTRLFQNLISNAIKFRGDKDPVVSILSEELKHHWKFTISDNGIGIDPKYAKRIFQVFQRLHTRTEYPGTGIGLALCKRIVERHGGEILMDSKEGQGATFIFTISKKIK